MPDHNGAMTMGEVIDAWNKDKQRIEELEAERDDANRVMREACTANAALIKRIKELEALARTVVDDPVQINLQRLEAELEVSDA